MRPFANPNFNGNAIIGNAGAVVQSQRVLAAARRTAASSATLTRDNLTGPGLATWDFSAIKNTTLHERLSLQFRAEIFNLLNRANFNTPSLIVFTPTGLSGTAGAITSTSTTARQVQFGLKLLW